VLSEWACAGVALEILRRGATVCHGWSPDWGQSLAEPPQAAAARENLIRQGQVGAGGGMPMREEAGPLWLAPGPNRAAILEIRAWIWLDTLGPEVNCQARALQRARDQQAVLRTMP